MSVQRYPAHPFANLFPMMADGDRDELVASMLARGFDPAEPIVLYEGQVLDGRNRQVALGLALASRRATGGDRTRGDAVRPHPLAPVYKHFHGTSDQALEYVLTRNLARRHLSTGQRALLAARMSTAQRGGDRRSDQPANLPDGPLVTQYAAAKRLGVSERSVRKAVALIKIDPDAAAVVANGARTLNGATKRPRVVHNSGNGEWWSPDDVIEGAHAVLEGIELDVFSCAAANGRVNAKRYFDKEHDAFAQQWNSRALWFQPEYENGFISRATDMLCREIARGVIGQAIALVNNATEVAWFQALLLRCSAVCFPARRLKFVRPGSDDSGTALQGQALLYFGQRPGAFVEVFRHFGFAAAIERGSPVLAAVSRALRPRGRLSL